MISIPDAGAVIEGTAVVVHGGTRLGERLVDAQVLTEAQILDALAEQQRTGKQLGAVLVESGAIDERTLLTVLSMQLGVPVADLRSHGDAPPITVAVDPHRPIEAVVEGDRLTIRVEIRLKVTGGAR